jgi:hypothetical protein
MAKKEICTGMSTCLCSFETSVFIGIVLFVMGLLFWAAEARIISPDLLWADTLMVVGILFALKGAFLSAIKK